MKSSVNLLLTSLSILGDRKSHRYFYFESEGNVQYCDGLSVAEAGAKYILSNVDIDEIIVLGSSRTYAEGEENKRIILREWSDFTSMDTRQISEYSFFQYRISQFLDGLDMEAIDVLDDKEGVRAEEITDGYRRFCDELSADPSYRPDRVFHIISSSNDVYERLLSFMPENLSDKEILWLERYIYTQFSDTMKLSRREDNTDIGIRFVPTSNDSSAAYVPAQNVSEIVRVLNETDGEEVNVYMDMQGLASAEGYTILAVLSMLSNDPNSRIFIKEIITSHYRPGRFANPIDNREMKRYDINYLVSGMSAFIRYGKVDEIQAYWDSRGIENPHIESLLYAMRRVDEGISLCNTADLESGIVMLKKVFANTPKEELPEVESNIFRILEIRQDYGTLLEGDTVDPLELVKWAMKKKFYQQSLTIIESRLPQNLVDSGVFYYAASPESRQEFLEEINLLYWDYAPKDRWNFSDLSHYFIKYYGRTQLHNRKRTGGPAKDKSKEFTEYRLDELDGKAEELTKAFSVLNERRDLLEDVLYTYYELGVIRNKINHAENEKVELREPDVNKENENLVILRDGINAFVKAYENARNYIRENIPESVDTFQIPPEEVSAYTSAHKLYPNEIREIRQNQKKTADTSKKSAEPEKTEADAPAEAKPADSENKAAEDKPAAAEEKPAGEETKTAVAAAVSDEKKTAPASGNRGYYRNRDSGYRRPNGNGRSYNRSSGDRQQTIRVGNGSSQITITIKVDD